jgi:hypothetical protein
MDGRVGRALLALRPFLVGQPDGTLQPGVRWYIQFLGKTLSSTSMLKKGPEASTSDNHSL